MTRKTTPYARKRAARARHQAAHPVSDANLAWITAIERSRPFDDDPVIPGLTAPTGSNAVAAAIMVRTALDDLLAHRVKPDDTRAADLVSHAIDMAHIRALQIQPDDDNPALPPLLAAKAAMYQVRQRRVRVGAWGLAGPEREQLLAAIDIYEDVLKASSPNQMAKAVDIRREALRKGYVWAPGIGE
ncbi:hypothetical protein [Hydrogenophaga electricum]|uniref:DUF4254 domain-containing protein n=1 Tax=Hydrogenophaga electricum TaxID=1230953 RepID=A0ABQ6BZS0_9BURK|nr:hypothetical protein [Hydrogenophaga electricum]GLS13638.1 hypothetical protein GCM10007935_10680 [Hydrogenophaga electricum]